MTNKKRILALVAAIVILMSCFMVAIIPASAAVDWFTCLYSANAVQGNVPTVYASWKDYLAFLYDNSNQTVYYFEVQNTELGGTRFAPDSIQWSLAYGANQTGYGDIDLVYRFYVPYYVNGHGWDFQIRTSTGLVAFDSSTADFYQHSIYSYIGYYEFTLNRNLIGFPEGWYIYSNEVPIVPANPDNVRMYNVQFDYYSHDSIVATRIYQYAASSELKSIDIPGIPDFQIYNAYGNGYFTGGDRFTLYNLTSDTIIRVDVLSVQDLLDEEYSRGYDRGKTEGRAEGIIQGYQDYKNTLEYADALDAAYRDGYKDAVDEGAENQLITNPLLFVTEPVVAFFEIQPYPGLPLGVIFLASVAVCLLVVFLKIFSGG